MYSLPSIKNICQSDILEFQDITKQEEVKSNDANVDDDQLINVFKEIQRTKPDKHFEMKHQLERTERKKINNT